jgi:hypothetical protein
MTNKALMKLSQEAGRVSVPSYIHRFLVEKGREITNFNDAYTELLEWVPENEKIPTLNEALLYYNIARLQELADAQLKAIAANEEKLKSFNPDTQSREIDRTKMHIERLEKKFHEFIKEILKYSNSGVDRETPKQINMQVNHLDLNSIHQQIREFKNITPDKDSE